MLFQVVLSCFDESNFIFFLIIFFLFIFFLEKGQPMKESLDNQQNSQMQRERYYATIHKVAMQDKVPGKYNVSILTGRACLILLEITDYCTVSYFFFFFL